MKSYFKILAGLGVLAIAVGVVTWNSRDGMVFELPSGSENVNVINP